MADTATTSPRHATDPKVLGELRRRRGQVATVVTSARSELTGEVFSVSSKSVWLVCDDTDVIVPAAEIVDLAAPATR